jgi:hypothetical protein
LFPLFASAGINIAQIDARLPENLFQNFPRAIVQVTNNKIIGSVVIVLGTSLPGQLAKKKAGNILRA